MNHFTDLQKVYEYKVYTNTNKNANASWFYLPVQSASRQRRILKTIGTR